MIVLVDLQALQGGSRHQRLSVTVPRFRRNNCHVVISFRTCLGQGLVVATSVVFLPSFQQSVIV